MKSLILLLYILLLSSSKGWAQETLDANDPNSFIFGGDQKSNTLSVEILPLAIVDVEPDPSGSLSFGASADDMEAGLPPMGGSGTNVNEELWLNFTHRSFNNQPARIYVSTNQVVPVGMTLKIEIIGAGTDGNYPQNPRVGEIILSESEQVIVYDFASGYTGDGQYKGYQLRYTIDNPEGVSLPTGFEVLYRIE
ncbi:MAG: hypothetical protein RIG62_14715 [Cyclobacteriaceae bacterium]